MNVEGKTPGDVLRILQEAEHTITFKLGKQFIEDLEAAVSQEWASVAAGPRPLVDLSCCRGWIICQTNKELVQNPTRNIQKLRRHYGLVVKIFAFGYKGRGFESPHVHFIFWRERENGL